MDRRAWLLDGLKPVSRLVEVGASYNPIAPKAAGWRTHVVDHAPQEELRAKYSALGVDPAEIEPVDTVWAGGRLHEAVPDSLAGQFDAIIASHVIEHIPDLVGFLASAERLLTPSGVVALAVPDQRYCFDVFKPLTTTGDVLEAHAAGRSVHGRRTLWNQLAYSVTMGGRGAWGQEPTRDLRFTDRFGSARSAMETFRDDPDAPYRDCHAWQFTPSRFRLTILELGQLGLVDWRIDALDKPWGAEFLCRLRRGAARIDDETALQRLRMAMLLDGLAEAREQIDFALGAREPQPGTFDGGAGWGALSLLRGVR